MAVVVHGAAYLVDAGPGLVRRAAAAHSAGIADLAQPNLKAVFLTHLHSDHTAGLADLMFTPWVLGRTAPLAVYGPSGAADMVDHLQQAYAQDVRIRLEGLEPANSTGWHAEGHDVTPGEVYRDSNVTVTAFAVPHGSWPQAFGYKFVTADRTIVISGDTRATDAIVAQCRSCDVLVHEVYSDSGFAQLPAEWQRYHAAFHTPASALGDLAARARPKLLVLYHGLPWSSSPAEIVRTARARWSGRVVYANDLDVF